MRLALHHYVYCLTSDTTYLCMKGKFTDYTAKDMHRNELTTLIKRKREQLFISRVFHPGLAIITRNVCECT